MKDKPIPAIMPDGSVYRGKQIPDSGPSDTCFPV